jgi:hypothetical protein
MMQLGAAIIGGLLKGLASKALDLLAWATGMSNDLKNIIKKSFGIASPSKVMMEMGGNIVAGFQKGIEDMGGIGVNVASGGVKSQPTLSPAMAGGGMGGGNIYQTYNVYAAPGSTDAQVRDISKKLAKMAKQFGAKGIK